MFSKPNNLYIEIVDSGMPEQICEWGARDEWQAPLRMGKWGKGQSP